MKIRNKITLSILLVGIIGLFASCDLTPDVAPIPTYDGQANTTIAQLLAMHEIGSADSYIHLSEDSADIIITGIVTTSDKHGNCYKYINIEDSTGGIQIKINNSALYNKYHVGQRVYVKCNGLDLGDYRKLPQLGMWANGSMQGIPSNKASMYVFADGKATPFEPVITLTSIPSSANDVPFEYYNRLVKIEGASFVEAGSATYSEANAATSHDINVAGGGTITLRTSNYADFIDEMLPTGTGTIVGILTRYNNYIQLVIRDLDDVQGFKATEHSVNILNVNYSNPWSSWLKETNGAEWQSQTSSSFNGFYINAANQSTDSWLISPAINLSGKNNPLLTFRHRAPAGGNNQTMKLYYTTNYNGVSTVWTPVPISTFGTSMVDFFYEIPSEAQTSNFRFAFQYSGSGSSWYITDLQLYVTESK